ncbi:hypothetical protein [Luteimonas kalidii]|jgi:hypothetical protein|uniref:Uncharacterized protein n=1 Tax=Luteimonas kalidii TaxID=3042025 RepID=A0ABT6JV87_9GAMM|nr:hypothetical protein [Luteimonas kalidii]MDH5834592.1 hypothetical protein [Luteimonas kalidii]
MSSVLFRTLHARFDASALRGLLTPRKPRNPLLKLALGLVGVAILAVLLVVGLFVGAAMVSFGLMRGALRARKAASVRSDVLDAEYRIVTRPGQPALR